MKLISLFVCFYISIFTFSQPVKENANSNKNTSLASSDIGGVINSYTPVTGFLPCENIITVEDGSSFKAGDTVLIIQMKGAIVDSSNTVSFGTISDYKNAGNYEFNYVKQVSGNSVSLKSLVTRQYDIPNGLVQLIKVPYFLSVNVTSILTCLAWNGKVGGILAFNVRDTLTLNADIIVTGKGFRGGSDPFSNPPVYYCDENQYYYPNNPDLASEKGEGIAIVSTSKTFGKGALGNGGGGGNSHNSGGAGGGNYANGGFGGYQFEGGDCSGSAPFNNRGIGGKALNYTNALNKIFMGGGGGAGQSNNPQGFQTLGGIGGGIIIINTDKLRSNNQKIVANGDDGLSCGNSGAACHEGMGGGGGGGTTLIKINSFFDVSKFEVKGGNGANMTSSGNLRVGPGGGGGGGVLWLSSSSIPSNVSSNLIGGQNGICTAYSNDVWGSTIGQNGGTILNLSIPIDTSLFKKNIDSVNFNSTKSGCANFNFNGLAKLNNGAMVTSWQWFFGDGATSGSQNTSHTYINTGIFTVKLVVTDALGCKDSISKNVNANTLAITKSPDSLICKNKAIQLFASGGTNYVWTPAASLDNPNIPNPIANPGLISTTYYVTVSAGAGCSASDSIKLTIKQISDFKVGMSPSTCINIPALLNASGGNIYNWTPAVGLSNPNISNPVALPAVSTTYSVKIKDSICNDSATLSTRLIVNPNPTISATSANEINCTIGSSQLLASGGNTYVWTPATGLNNPNKYNPVATPGASTIYTVTGTDLNGCKESASVSVIVAFSSGSKYYMPNSFTPNTDGLNDCFGLKNWGQVTDLRFSIFNRWGQLVYYSENPVECWNGKYKGELQQSGNFVYIVKAKTACGLVDLKGNVVLIR